MREGEIEIGHSRHLISHTVIKRCISSVHKERFPPATLFSSNGRFPFFPQGRRGREEELGASSTIELTAQRVTGIITDICEIS